MLLRNIKFRCIAHWVPSPSGLGGGGGGIPNTCNEFNVQSNDPTSLDLCASTVINRDNLDEVPIFSLISPSLQATVPAEMGIAHQSYLQAAAGKTHPVFIPTASMPTVEFRLTDKKGTVLNETREMYLDTGNNVNLISRKALNRDFAKLGPEAVVYKIRPFTVSLADGKSHAITIQLVDNAWLAIGPAFYHVFFLIVDLTQDYLIGMPVLYMYDGQIKPAAREFAIGVPKKNPISKNSDKYYKPYHTTPLKLSTKKLTLATD
jgi:hypothetical protein